MKCNKIDNVNRTYTSAIIINWKAPLFSSNCTDSVCLKPRFHTIIHICHRFNVCYASATTKMHLIEIYANMYKMEILMTNLKLETVIWRALKWNYSRNSLMPNCNRTKRKMVKKEKQFWTCNLCGKNNNNSNDQREEKEKKRHFFMQTLSMEYLYINVFSKIIIIMKWNERKNSKQCHTDCNKIKHYKEPEFPFIRT